LIDAIAYSPNGKCIAYVERGWAESRLRIWDLARHTQISDFRVSNDKPIDLFAPGPHAIAWSPDSHLLAVADPGSSSTPLAPKVRIWNNMGKRVSTIAGPASLTILEVQFSPDSRLLAATFKTNGSNFVQFRTACTSWDVATGAEVSTVSDDWIRLRAGLSVLCDRGFRGAPQRVRVTNLGDTSPIFEYPVQAQERPVGSILAEDGKTLTLISETANPVVSWLARRNRVIPFLPVSSDNIQIVDGPTRTEIACVPLPSRALNAPSTVRWSEISPNGRCYARCESEMLQIWNLPPGKSRGWLAGSTALLALPIALGAWRRSRKLRAA
jgi:WD40 repeat protein